MAKLYQVETKALNRAAKRNEGRFPEDFRFQLTSDEAEVLRCQFGTSSDPAEEPARGGRRYLPYVYTEQGVAMLSAVLRSKVAVDTSVQIMRAFVEMRHFLANNEVLFEQIRNVELKLHTTNKFHDRFLILDRKEGYLIGTSLKDAGRRTFGIVRLEDQEHVQALLGRLDRLAQAQSKSAHPKKAQTQLPRAYHNDSLQRQPTVMNFNPDGQAPAQPQLSLLE